MCLAQHLIGKILSMDFYAKAVFLLRISIARNGKYHNSLCLSTQILNKHCFQFLGIYKWSQEKIKTMLIQNLGGQTKSIMVFSVTLRHYLLIGRQRVESRET